jgi:type I pantothenate kinase
MTLTEAEVLSLRGINEQLSIKEVEEVYLPLSRLLSLYVEATNGLHQVSDTFLGCSAVKAPYVVGVAGSVAVGKSIFARALQALLSRWPGHPIVDLVTTDGFLLSNRELERRGLMQRKGFPESYDLRRLVHFLAALKSGQRRVTAPVYSHLIYDIVPGETQVIERPDIVIVEGLNVLQTRMPDRHPRLFVSDFFDFSIFVNADVRDIREWYVERFMTLRGTAFRNPVSYFHRYASLEVDEARRVAREIWSTINEVNLVENILPTRKRARLVLRKSSDHLVQRVLLRKL